MAILESGLQNKPQKSTPPTHAQTSLLFITPSHSHQLSFWGNSSTVLSIGTFCSDANILYLCNPIW